MQRIDIFRPRCGTWGGRHQSNNRTTEVGSEDPTLHARRSSDRDILGVNIFTTNSILDFQRSYAPQENFINAGGGGVTLNEMKWAQAARSRSIDASLGPCRCRKPVMGGTNRGERVQEEGKQRAKQTTAKRHPDPPDMRYAVCGKSAGWVHAAVTVSRSRDRTAKSRAKMAGTRS